MHLWRRQLGLHGPSGFLQPGDGQRQRNGWLALYLRLHNGPRCQMALGDLSSPSNGCWSLNDLARKHT